MEPAIGIEPMTSRLQITRLTFKNNHYSLFLSGILPFIAYFKEMLKMFVSLFV